MKKIVTTTLALSLMVGITGCTKTTGNVNINKASVKTLKQDIKIGFTTKDDLVKKFGEPTIKTQENGMDKWQFVYAETQTDNINFIPFVGLFTGAKSKIKHKIIVVYFDKDGKVKEYKLETRNTQKGIGDVFKFNLK